MYQSALTPQRELDEGGRKERLESATWTLVHGPHRASCHRSSFLRASAFRSLPASGTQRACTSILSTTDVSSEMRRGTVSHRMKSNPCCGAPRGGPASPLCAAPIHTRSLAPTCEVLLKAHKPRWMSTEVSVARKASGMLRTAHRHRLASYEKPRTAACRPFRLTITTASKHHQASKHQNNTQLHSRQ